MEETDRVEIRVEPVDDDTARLTVTGDPEIVAAMFALVAGVLSLAGDGEGDCGDPDCPVHGEGAEAPDLDDLAGAA